MRGRLQKVADPKRREERREIVIIREGKEGATASQPERRIRIVDVEGGKPGERRELRIRRAPGAAGERMATFSCEDGAQLHSEATEQDSKKSIVMTCAKGSGNQLEALERATQRFAENNNCRRMSVRGCSAR